MQVYHCEKRGLPEARLIMKNFQKFLWGSTGGSRLLMLSLKAKLKA